MVQSVLSMVNKEIRGLHQAAYVLAGFTFGSQLLALIRDRLLAHEFGAGIELDLYYAAFRIPDVLYVLFASTLSVYVLIPFLSRRIEEGSPLAGKALLSQIFSLFVIVYIAIALCAMWAAPYIVKVFFPGFLQHSEMLVLLMRILLLQPLLLGISSLLGVITQIGHRFVLYALSPLLYNLGIIFGLLVLYPFFGMRGLVFGVVLGALGHVCIQLPSVMKSSLMPSFTFSFSMREILEICRTSITRALTLSLHQLVLLGLVGLASIMAVGSVSVFQFAYNLQSVPLAIIGVSYSVAAFPLLAQLYAEKKFELFSSNITTAIRHILFWSLPAIALFIVIRAQFVRVVLGSGEFDWSDTRLTAAVLALFILSLTAQALHLLLVRALYAVGNTRLPFYTTLFSSMFALVVAFVSYAALAGGGTLYAFMEVLMRLEGVSGIEVLALPLGYSCALIVHSIVLLALSRRHIRVATKSLVRPLLQGLTAAFFGGFVSYTVLNYFVTAFTTDTLMTVFSQGLLAAIGGLAGYILLQHAMKNNELREIYATLERKFTKSSVIVPQDEDTLAV